MPEAGSYQHTDTEVEDDSSGDEGLVVGGNVGAGGRAPIQGTAQGIRERNMRPGTTALGGSGVLESSVFGSSPAVQVSYQGRRGSGGGRGRGREN